MLFRSAKNQRRECGRRKQQREAQRQPAAPGFPRGDGEEGAGAGGQAEGGGFVCRGKEAAHRDGGNVSPDFSS